MRPIMMLVVPQNLIEPLEHIAEVPKLSTLQGYVGGWLQMAVLGDGWHVYCDEEGKINGKLMNPRATILARTLGWEAEDVLCGTVLFLGTTPGGNETHVPRVVLQAAVDLSMLPEWTPMPL